MTKTELMQHTSIYSVCEKLGYPKNGRGFNYVRELLDEYNLPPDFFNKKSQYNKNPKTCKECGKKIPFDKKENSFCNNSCSATYNNKGRIRTEESKRKVAESIRKLNNKKDEYIDKVCPICETIFTKRNTTRENRAKYCSEDCRKIGRSKNLSKAVQERIKNGLHKGWQSRNILSYPEKFFIEVLNNNNIKFEHNKPIKKRELGLECSSNYFLDFYIECGNIDLEIDGKQHELGERKTHDIDRDDILTKNGYNVYRIKWKSINNKKVKNILKKK